MIYTLTLNPAVDRELTVPKLEHNSVLRASAARVDAGGKGFNVSRALSALDVPSVAVGIVGGTAGQLLRQILGVLGVQTEFVWVEGETRTNVSIVSETQPGYIKVNETGPLVPAAKQDELTDKIAALAQPGDLWVLSGSLPPGVPVSIYATLITLLNARGARVVLDSSGEALRLGCAARPFLVKPNAEEAGQITGLPLATNADIAALAGAVQALGAHNVVISRGKQGALLRTPDGVWLAQSPVIKEVNPVGAGDAMVGGLVAALARGLALPGALSWGLASGAAAASLSGTAMGSQALVAQLQTQARVAPLAAG